MWISEFGPFWKPIFKLNSQKKPKKIHEDEHFAKEKKQD